MRVISRRAIREFVQKHARAEAALDTWYRIALQADWATLVDVQQVYPHADAVGKCTVFNIHGNRYRLIARVNYEHRTIYIRDILTHKEYDEEGWKHGCESV
jgi:mRNA interferase HigB